MERGDALVSNICKKCYKKFFRDGDLLSVSSSFTTPFAKSNLTLENVSSYLEWVLFAADYCDNCLPPVPEKVKKDIEKEKERRQNAVLEHRNYRGKYYISNHEERDIFIESDAEYILQEKDEYIGKEQVSEKDNRNNGASKQRERHLRRKNSWKVRNITDGDW